MKIAITTAGLSGWLRLVIRIWVAVVGFAATAVGLGTAEAKVAAERDTLEQRVLAARAALEAVRGRDLEGTVAKEEADESGKQAQWYNWPNWGNWANWPNWPNWGNWWNR